MIDPPYVNPQHRVQPKRWAYRCAVLVAVLLMLAVFAALAWVVFVYAMLLRYKMMPPAGTSPLILLGLQWWPLNPPGGVCPGSASAYRLDEAWVGSSNDRSFFDPDTWNFWHGSTVEKGCSLDTYCCSLVCIRLQPGLVDLARSKCLHGSAPARLLLPLLSLRLVALGSLALQGEARPPGSQERPHSCSSEPPSEASRPFHCLQSRPFHCAGPSRHGTADPTGGPTQYVDHATALANGMLEEGDGWAVMRAGRPVRPETSELVPATFQAVEGPQMRQACQPALNPSPRPYPRPRPRPRPRPSPSPSPSPKPSPSPNPDPNPNAERADDEQA